ncbi:Sds3-like-domain-containing protein [Coniochaeta sp. 2T2.1]|nr:Sds3-like-domain-containing protein [Coniochaeta sp. 2T2.1]
MATNDVTMLDGPAGGRPDRRANNSPTLLSKRDKKRAMLIDRLAALGDKFGLDRDRAYREQLQKIQVDTNLVMRVDAHAERPLDDLDGEHLQLSRANSEANNHPGPRTLLEMAGPRFQDWLVNVQDLVEERDYYLTKYTNDFEKKVQQYHNVHIHKVETAKREHKALAQTLRDRLLNTITSKKYRLNKEKEALEISDASALLLHPNQFSLTNPASPGGTHTKRTTRLRREMDDMSGLDNKKRKRNAAEDDGSPAPQRRALDPSSTTPLWQGDRLTNRKTTGPVYSIDKLFTDKELSMTYNAAAVAAHKYILTHKPKLDENGQVVASPDGSDSGNGENEDSESVPSAPAMERNVSHATRSARGAPNFSDDKLLGLEALSNLDFPNNFEKVLGNDPKLPPIFPSTYVRGPPKISDYSQPTSLPPDEQNADWMVINVLKQYDEQHGPGASLDNENGSRRILEAVAHPAKQNRYAAYLQGERPSENDIRQRLGMPVVIEPEKAAAIGSAIDRIGTPSKGIRSGRSATPNQSPAKALGQAPTSVPMGAIGGVSMSRQSSASGAPMSRSSSRKGRTRGG